MVSSTDIPKAILNTKMVEGLIGIPKYPIRPPVTNNGNRFGISEIKIIWVDLNIQPMNTEINRMAKESEITKLLIK